MAVKGKDKGIYRQANELKPPQEATLCLWIVPLDYMVPLLLSCPIFLLFVNRKER